MNYWSVIKLKLKDQITLASQLLLLVLGSYVFILAEDHKLWKIPVIFLGLITGFLFRNKTKHPIIWMVFLLLLIIDLFYAYFWVANHHFMLVFMVLSVILFSYHKQGDILLKNIQLLLVIVLLVSVVQKITSNQFMSGDFYYHAINLGGLFKFLFPIFPESLEIAKMNSESLMSLKELNPNLTEHIVLKDVFPNLSFVSRVFAWFTVLFEFLAAVALLWKPKKIGTHIIFIILLFGILLTRLETGFISLLAISGLYLCKTIKLRLLYVFIILGCITLIMTKFGYH
ncbi:hypothetical protein [Winogradskyella pacifica]|uniref:Uncharacterized protein n=1 Tax=Winogradskyella pacifica TaxID=664642 RepID=A0A3D9N3L0_9FLAO|nr:hypothetical protein [Winogradskyella pacifica]REE25544.1 hypothetical protein DFQ09_102134 [Winogradskyella pacifica]